MLDLTTAKIETKPCSLKPVPLQAVQVHQEFTVDTYEGTIEGLPGDYLVIDEHGVRCVYAKDYFDDHFVWLELSAPVA